MHTVIYTSIPEGGVNVNTSALVEEGYYAAPKAHGKGNYGRPVQFLWEPYEIVCPHVFGHIK